MATGYLFIVVRLQDILIAVAYSRHRKFLAALMGFMVFHVCISFQVDSYLASESYTIAPFSYAQLTAADPRFICVLPFSEIMHEALL